MTGQYLESLLKSEHTQVSVLKEGKWYRISVINFRRGAGARIILLPKIERDVQVMDEFGNYLGDSPNFPWKALDKIAEKGNGSFMWTSEIWDLI